MFIGVNCGNNSVRYAYLHFAATEMGKERLFNSLKVTQQACSWKRIWTLAVYPHCPHFLPLYYVVTRGTGPSEVEVANDVTEQFAEESSF